MSALVYAWSPNLWWFESRQGFFCSSRLPAYNAPIFFNMGAHMKTTIEMSDGLFSSAKALAQERQTTLRALVEEGLRRVLNDAQLTSKPAFRLKDARVHGQAMLVTDSREWQQMEDEHVLARLAQPRP